MPVHTLGDYKKPDKKKGDEKGKPATSYTGGHSSGLAVQNRPDEEEGGEGWRERIVKKAREMGVPETGPGPEPEAPPAAFGGEGRRLGLTNETPAVPAQAKKEKKEKPKAVINMWDEGFSVDDGPLRRYDDPANKEFMDKLNTGRVPFELLARAIEVTGEPEIDVTLAPHHGPFKAPEKKFKAFGGGGRTMNDEGPAGMEEEEPQPPKPAGGPPPAAAEKPVEGKDIKMAVDNTKPVTTIQVRLLDGTRLQARLNLDHTVGDLRRFVAMAAPNTPDFDLITPFPRTVFSDENQTIEAAGLKQASVNMIKK